MDKLSYALGLGIGQQLAQMGANDISADDFAQAIKDVLEGNELKVSHRDAQTIVQEYFAKQQEKIKAERAEQGKVHKEAGEKYLAENAKKEGIVTLPSGLQYQVLKEGNGKKPTAKDTVMCHYEGTLIDGTVFDSSYRARYIPLAAGHRRLDRGSAADAGGCEVSFLHPLSSGLRCWWRWRFYSSVCSSDLRCGVDPGGEVMYSRELRIFV